LRQRARPCRRPLATTSSWSASWWISTTRSSCSSSIASRRKRSWPQPPRCTKTHSRFIVPLLTTLSLARQQF
jgi:hypothetical protein